MNRIKSLLVTLTVAMVMCSAILPPSISAEPANIADPANDEQCSASSSFEETLNGFLRKPKKTPVDRVCKQICRGGLIAKKFCSHVCKEVVNDVDRLISRSRLRKGCRESQIDCQASGCGGSAIRKQCRSAAKFCFEELGDSVVGTSYSDKGFGCPCVQEEKECDDGFSIPEGDVCPDKKCENCGSECKTGICCPSFKDEPRSCQLSCCPHDMCGEDGGTCCPLDGYECVDKQCVLKTPAPTNAKTPAPTPAPDTCPPENVCEGTNRYGCCDEEGYLCVRDYESPECGFCCNVWKCCPRTHITCGSAMCGCLAESCVGQPSCLEQ